MVSGRLTTDYKTTFTQTRHLVSGVCLLCKNAPIIGGVVLLGRGCSLWQDARVFEFLPDKLHRPVGSAVG